MAIITIAATNPASYPTLPSREFIALREVDDVDACITLQRSIWKFNDLDIIPGHVFIAARSFGGQLLGAFDGVKQIGFSLGLCVQDSRGFHLHSIMTGVQEEYRDCGVGYQLKLAQRKDALLRGIHKITWTFDPLMPRNAHFNLNKLGAVGCRYLIDLYGSTSSDLHSGLPTDRLLVEWNLDPLQVCRRLARGASSPWTEDIQVAIPSSHLRDIKARKDAQDILRAKLPPLLEKGYVITGFLALQKNAVYLLTRNETN